MNKRITTLIITAVLTLCACSDTMSEQATETTTVVSEITSVSTAVTETTTVTSATTEAITNTAVTTTTETTTSIDYSSFSLMDYYGDFDEAEPMGYKMVNAETVMADNDENRIDIAVEAIRNSDYYTEIIEQAKDFFTYENGEFVRNSEHYMAEGYEGCLEFDETEGYVVQPQLIDNIYLDFDLQNMETLFVFRLPLIDSQIEWSGTSVFFLPVYVNAENEAYILHDAVAQSLHGTTIIKYEDGYHLFFNRGHTTGTSRAHIYSFKNGEPKLEYEGTYINYHDEGLFFTNDHSGGLGSARVGFFRDKIQDCYCGVAALPLEGEAAEIIRNSEKVKEEFGTMRDLFIVGGEYVLIPMADCFSFENGRLIDADIGINCPPHENDFEIVLNIDFSEYR